eukprot:1156184-Pelagomonas_calceolata.AAC.6
MCPLTVHCGSTHGRCLSDSSTGLVIFSSMAGEIPIMAEPPQEMNRKMRELVGSRRMQDQASFVGAD